MVTEANYLYFRRNNQAVIFNFTSIFILISMHFSALIHFKFSEIYGWQNSQKIYRLVVDWQNKFSVL